MSVAKSTSSEQIRISDTGELETQPVTWDGEPMFSPDTVREGLFSVEPFEQIRGQLAIEDGDNGR